MILDLETGKFEFLEAWNTKTIKVASLGLSGGTDSAALLYLLCLTIPHAKIACYCAVEDASHKPLSRKPTNVWYARDIFDKMQEHFPHVNMIFESFSFDREDPIAVAKAQKMWNDADNTDELPNFRGLCKIMSIVPPIDEFKARHKVDVSFVGITKNPPLDVQKELGFEHTNIEKRRDFDRPLIIGKPFENHDKKTIAAIFKKFDFLMNEIFPLTQSCTGNYKDTDYFTKPCGKCYWCYEKLWAFGTLDIC